MAVINRPHAEVEQDGSEFVVVLIKPRGERTYYVSTDVDEDGKLVPLVSTGVDKAKHFGLERSARIVAGDMTAFLHREYSNMIMWM